MTDYKKSMVNENLSKLACLLQKDSPLVGKKCSEYNTNKCDWWTCEIYFEKDLDRFCEYIAEKFLEVNPRLK